MMAGERPKSKSANQVDMLALAERLVSYAENEGEKSIELPTRMARLTLDLAKRARKLGRGPKGIHRYDRLAEDLIIREARRRKAELANNGIPKEQAEEQAAQEASASLHKRTGRNLAASTIKRRMQRR
jgi:hypothetical protein